MRFQIFGERCSGTNYLEHLLKNNFGTTTVTWAFGHKHWFINHDKIASTSTEDIVFIAIIRNLQDWIRSLFHQPHHISHRYHKMYSFITRPVVSTPREGYTEQHDNVFQLRKAKLQDLFKLRETAKNVVYVRYEHIRDYPEQFIRMLSSQYNIPTISDDIVHVTSYKGLGKRDYTAPEYEPFKLKERSIIQSKTDWSTEALLDSYITDISHPQMYI